MTVAQLLMIKGVASVREIFAFNPAPMVEIYLWPWWYHIPRLRRRVDQALMDRMALPIVWRLRPWHPWSGAPLGSSIRSQ